MRRWQRLAEELWREHGRDLVAHASLLAETDDGAEVLARSAVERVLSARRLPADVEAAAHAVREAMAHLTVRPPRGRATAPDGAAAGTVNVGMQSVPAPDTTAAEALNEAEGESLRRSLAARTALRTLPPFARACVVLRHVDGLDVRRISALLDVDADRVRAELARAADVAHRIGVAAPEPELETVDVTPGRGRR